MPSGQTVRVGRVAAGFVIAVLAWVAALIAAFNVPGSPFARVPVVMRRLGDPDAGPAAFDELLSLGPPMEVIASLAFPFVAALTVTLASRSWLKLTVRESVLVVLAFGAFVLSWGWDSPTAFDALAIGVFAAIVMAPAVAVRRAGATARFL